MTLVADHWRSGDDRVTKRLVPDGGEKDDYGEKAGSG